MVWCKEFVSKLSGWGGRRVSRDLDETRLTWVDSCWTWVMGAWRIMFENFHNKKLQNMLWGTDIRFTLQQLVKIHWVLS